MGKLRLVFQIFKYAANAYPIIVTFIKFRKGTKMDNNTKSSEFGINETMDGLDFIVPFANKIDETTSDGFKIIEAIEIAPTLTKLPAAIQGGADIPKELADLDPHEREQLRVKIEGFEFVSENAEDIAEKGVMALVALGELIGAIRKGRR